MIRGSALRKLLMTKILKTNVFLSLYLLFRDGNRDFAAQYRNFGSKWSDSEEGGCGALTLDGKRTYWLDWQSKASIAKGVRNCFRLHSWIGGEGLQSQQDILGAVEAVEGRWGWNWNA